MTLNAIEIQCDPLPPSDAMNNRKRQRMTTNAINKRLISLVTRLIRVINKVMLLTTKQDIKKTKGGLVQG